MTRLNKGTKRLTSILSAAAIASVIALPGLAQSTRPGNTTPPSNTPTSPSLNPGTTPATPSRPTSGTIPNPNTRPAPGTSTTPGATTPGTTPGTITPGATTPSRDVISSLDREFVTLAYQGNNAEIQTSQLALQRSQNQSVRQYAERMIREHTQANQLLTQYARQRNITLPTATVDPLNRAIAERLSQLSGTEFDQAYMAAQATAHLRTVALFETEIGQGQDQGLRSYASQLLPNIQDHYQMASQMAPNYRAGDVRPEMNPNMNMTQPVR